MTAEPEPSRFGKKIDQRNYLANEWIEKGIPERKHYPSNMRNTILHSGQPQFYKPKLIGVCQNLIK